MSARSDTDVTSSRPCSNQSSIPLHWRILQPKQAILSPTPLRSIFHNGMERYGAHSRIAPALPLSASRM